MSDRFSEYEKLMRAFASEAYLQGRGAALGSWYAENQRVVERVTSSLHPFVMAEGKYDESKHKRGGNPKNRGQFSKQQGSGGGEDESKPAEKKDEGPLPPERGEPSNRLMNTSSAKVEDAIAAVKADPDSAKAMFKKIMKQDDWTEEDLLVAGGLALELSRLQVEDSINLREYNERVPSPEDAQMNLKPEYANLPPEASWQRFKSFAQLWDTVPETTHLFRECADMGKGISARLGATVADIEGQGKKGVDALNRWKKNPKGFCVIIAPNKKEDVAKKKMEKRKKGQLGEINDLVRGTIGCPSYDDVQVAYDAVLAEAAERGWQIVEQSDNIKNPKGGYRDINLRMRAPNGHVVEMQINSAAMLSVKDDAHTLYEVARNIGPLITKGTASEELGKLHGRLTTRAAQIFNYAHKNSYPNRKGKFKEKEAAG